MTPFQQFIQEIPHGQYATFRNMLKLEMLKAGISISDEAIRNWELGTYEPITDAKREIINQCAEAITGKPIYQPSNQ